MEADDLTGLSEERQAHRGRGGATKEKFSFVGTAKELQKVKMADKNAWSERWQKERNAARQYSGN